MTSVVEPAVTVSDLPERAKSLAPLLDQHAQAAEEKGSLTDEVFEALSRERLFALWLPRVLGGYELDPVPSLEVLENLSYGDPSACWVVMAASLAVGTGGAYLGDEAAEELFGDNRLPVITGQGTRPGVAIPHDGGYLLTGSWSFASGLKHSTHIHTLAVVEGTGEPRIFVLPIELGTLIDNWDVLGLRATGSIDYTLDSAYVPEAYSNPAMTETPKRGGYLYRMGAIGFAEICHTGWALGVGRRLLDELASLSQNRLGRPGAQAASDSFQEGFGVAEGKLRAARAFAFETWRDSQETLARGESLTQRQHTLIRLALHHTTWAVQDISMFVYLAGGTTALRSGTIQRLFRDVHAGTQHVTSAPPIVRACGRELAGLAPGSRWQFLELVDSA
jgi:alkylation response protein AidB-like acyl-CoA dehydrogenase